MEKIARQILDLCAGHGIRQAEVYLQRTDSTTVEIQKQAVDTLKLAQNEGVGLRIIEEGRLGFAYCAQLNPGQWPDLVAQAQAGARHTEADPYLEFPAASPAYPAVDCFDPKMDEIPISQKIEMAKELEREVYAADPRIKRSRLITYRDDRMQVHIANSNGVNIGYEVTYCATSALVIAEDKGESQVGWEMDNHHHFSQLKSPRWVGRSASRRALAMLGARQINTQRTYIVLDPLVAAEIFGIFSAAFFASAVQKGKSVLGDKFGQRIASPYVTMVDDGRYADGLEAAPADGEGVPARRTVLVEQGYLRGFLHNTYTACKAREVYSDSQAASTANGVRSAFTSPPKVGATNLFVLPGQIFPENLIARTPAGLYIEQVMGAHTIDAISGDFSVGASGHWISNGAFTYPVRGVVISGNILDLLKNIDLVADDLRFMGGLGAPTMRIADITVSGA